LVLAGLLLLGSGQAVLGAHGADWAEAFGAYTLATLALFGTIAWSLRLPASPGGPLHGNHD